MNMILSYSRMGYSQTIRVHNNKDNEVKIICDNEIFYDGIAQNIVDTGNKLTFEDKNGKEYEFIKFSTYITS